jgi:hypothetical protein
VLLVGFVLLALSVRCHDYFVNPDLRAEDGKSVYAFFYQHREVQRLYRVKAGYVPFIPNLLGFIAVRLPPRTAPYFLTLVPLLFTVAAFCVFHASAFRCHVQSQRLRTCCCIGLALAPIGTFFLVCHTDYSIWNLYLLLLWLVIIPLPRQKWLAGLMTVLLGACIWSHPLSIAAVPATLYWLWAEKRLFQRLLQALLLCTQALHLIFGTHSETAAFAHGSQGLLGLAWSALAKCFAVYIETLPGTLFPYATALSPRLGQACAAGLLFALAACAVLPLKLRVSRSLLLWILYCVVVPHLMVVLVRASGLYSSRYLYIMRAFALVGCCILLWEALTLLVAKLQRFPRLQALKWLPELLVIGFCATLNRPGTNENYRQPDPENGQIIKACFAELDRLQRERGSPCHLAVPCRKKHGDWAFVIDSRKNCED